jgi:hypothetical protein
MRKDAMINESVIREEAGQRIQEVAQIGDRLVEKWSKKRNLGEGLDKMYAEDRKRARNTAIVLENQEKYLKRLTEAQISSDFATTPINVLRVIRLGYPNSVRGDIFHEFAMTTARDSIYYLKPVYESTARGATSGYTTYENGSDRYFSEYEQEGPTQSPNGGTFTFTGADSGNLAKRPLRPYTVRVILNGVTVANDNGANGFIGAAVNTTTSTVNYTTGAISVVFLVAPATGASIVFEYAFDSEVYGALGSGQGYDNIKSVKLTLQDYNFKARPWPLYISWSKMTELLLGTTLDIDAEEGLLRGAGDELKKSLDYQAVRLGYSYAKAQNTVTFNADFAAAGADSAKDHAQSLTRTIAQAEKVIYNALQRGGITNLVAGTDVASYLTLHDRFTEEGQMPKIGVYRIGTLLGIPVYQAPSNVMATNEMFGVWRNEQEMNDVAIAFGVLVPLYQTQTLEFKEAYKTSGLYYFGDQKVLNSGYLVNITINGLSYT